MRLHRFYVKQPLGEVLVVDNDGGNKELIHQWASVFRYTHGNEVILFSSHDTYDYTYLIEDISKKGATLYFVSKSKNKTSPSRMCTLYMALVKKDTFESIVRQATELGISRIVPILADRSEKKNLNFERLVAIATEASEQSGRASVPTIGEIQSFAQALTDTKDEINLLGSLTGKPFEKIRKDVLEKNTTINVWIGPEGGWTEQEELLAKEHAFFDVQLTKTVLKADTAALTALSLVLTD